MKKKIALLLILIMVSTLIFAGCNMVKLNEDRDNALVVATVNYEGLSSTVTKGELKTYFNTQGYVLVSYGMTVQAAYDYCAKSLAQSELLRLKALKELCELPEINLDPNTIKVFDPNNVNGETADYPNVFTNLLYLDEKIKVIENYNKQMDNLIENYIKEIEKERQLANSDDEEEEDDKDEEEVIEDKPEIRAARGEEAEAPFKPVSDKSLTDEEKTARLEKLSTLYRFEKQWEIDAKEGGKGHTDDEIEAKKRLDKQMQKIGKTYDDFFEDIVNGMLIDHYKRQVSSVVDKEVDSLYESKKEEIIKANKDAFIIEEQVGDTIETKFKEDAYKASLGKNTEETLYHQLVADSENESTPGSMGYGYTFNILLKFSPVDTNLYKSLYNRYNRDGIISPEEQADLAEKAATYAARIKVNISNPNYKPDAKCSSGITSDHLNDKNENGEYKYKDKYGYHKCDDPNCPLKPFGYDVGTAYDTVLTEDEKNLIKDGYGIDIVTILKMINFDLNAINAKYDKELQDLGNMADADKKIEIEFNRQVALRECFVQWMYKVNDDGGMFDTNNTKGYLVSKNGKSDYVDQYTDQARKLMGGVKNEDTGKYSYNYSNYVSEHYVGNYVTGNTTISDNKNAQFGDFANMMAISEYGIHIIMIADMPGYYSTNNILNDNAIATYNRSSFITVEEALKTTIRTALETAKYNEMTVNLVNNMDKYISVNTDVYKNLYSK